MHYRRGLQTDLAEKIAKNRLKTTTIGLAYQASVSAFDSRLSAFPMSRNAKTGKLVLLRLEIGFIYSYISGSLAGSLTA